jgi:hypothetical protein
LFLYQTSFYQPQSNKNFWLQKMELNKKNYLNFNFK